MCAAGSLGLCSNLAQVNGTNSTLSVLGGTTSPTTSTQPQFSYAFSACQDPGSNGVPTLRIFGFAIHLAQVLFATCPSCVLRIASEWWFMHMYGLLPPGVPD